jgi:hypothetical protein
MDPKRVEAVTQWPQPKSVHDIQVFLGFVNFYRRFIKGYLHITCPLIKLLKVSSKIEENGDGQNQPARQVPAQRAREVKGTNRISPSIEKPEGKGMVFQTAYQPGKRNPADASSRRPNYVPSMDEVNEQAGQLLSNLHRKLVQIGLTLSLWVYTGCLLSLAVTGVA